MGSDRFSEKNTNAGGTGFGNLDKNALVLMGDHFRLLIGGSGGSCSEQTIMNQ